MGNSFCKDFWDNRDNEWWFRWETDMIVKRKLQRFNWIEEGRRLGAIQELRKVVAFMEKEKWRTQATWRQRFDTAEYSFKKCLEKAELEVERGAKTK